MRKFQIPNLLLLTALVPPEPTNHLSQSFSVILFDELKPNFIRQQPQASRPLARSRREAKFSRPPVMSELRAPISIKLSIKIRPPLPKGKREMRCSQSLFQGHRELKPHKRGASTIFFIHFNFRMPLISRIVSHENPVIRQGKQVE